MTGAEETSPSPAQWAGRGEAAPAARTPRRRLFRKYALIFIGLVGAALLINGAFDFWFSYQENKAALVRIQQEKADAAAQRIAEFVEEIKSQIGWTTHAQWAAGPLDQRRQDYVRLLRQVPAITELTQLDGEGKEQLKVSRLAMDVVGSEADFSQSPAFTEAKAHRTWFSPVYFRKESEPYMTLAMARDGRNAGVTVAEINLKLIWDVITALKIGQGGYAYVVDGHGRLIAHPDISLVLRDTDLSKLPQVAAALNPQPGEPAVTTADNLAGRSVLTAHAAIPQLGWRVFVEVPLSEAFAPLYGAALRTLVLLALGLIAATLVALVIARRMTGPIHAIAAGAERLGAGELDRRIDIQTGDELEGLAQQFNRMAADLQKSYAELEQRVADRTAELSEALEQQTATAEVLGVINRSPGELTPVFESILDKAMALCEAAFGTLLTFDGELFHAVAHRGVPLDLVEILREPGRPTPGGSFARLVQGEAVVQLTDIADDDAYRLGLRGRVAMVDIGGARTAIWIALRKDEALLGTLVIYRQAVRPFSDKQIALLENFAAQAVIAMENARLITETREALEQQTATAEVLGVINSSPGDLAPVFDAMLEKALVLCGAAFGMMWTYDGQGFTAIASLGVPRQYADFLAANRLIPPSNSRTGFGQMIAGSDFVGYNDLSTEDAYLNSGTGARALIELGGARTAMMTALRKDSVLIGAITAYRQEVRPFTEKQIALLQNFAAQAVIAMENARLITETREALEQQTATAEVLQVINASPGDLTPVFDAILEKAHSLCGVAQGSLQLYDGENFRAVATRGLAFSFAEELRQGYPASSDSATKPLIEGEPFTHILDVAQHEFPFVRNPGDVTGARTLLSVPLRRDDRLLGMIVSARREVRPFTEKQIALLQNFATQAVIAMENARLLTETREALEQQTATAEVLGVINSSPGDLAPVFDAMLEKAMRLCEASGGALRSYDGKAFHAAAMRGVPAAFVEATQIIVSDADLALGRIERGAHVIQISDLTDPKLSQANAQRRRELLDLGGIRTALWVALRKDDALLGAFVLYRDRVQPFTDKQVALVENFAAQAVIAMENARLITETREALEQQTATAEVLRVINSSPGDLAPVFQSILEKAHSLCGVGSGSLQLYDGEMFRATAVQGIAEAWAERLRQGFRGSENPVTKPLLEGERFVHVADLAEVDHPVPRAAVEIGGFRTALFVPLRRDNNLLGMIVSARLEVRPFSEKEISLLENFAAQAVIAMENARLITETREALEQQTATAEVLGVINASPGDLAPVFDAILEKAHSLCGATLGALMTFDGGRFQTVAAHNVPAPFQEFVREGLLPTPVNPFGRLMRGEPFVHVDDLAEVAALVTDDPTLRAACEIGGIRTQLVVPLRKDDKLLGVITANRREVRPFTDKQIALLQNFAAQAVIAMENARLITETRERTRDLQESLEYQTATSDVLKVISQSTFDLQPVLQAVVDTAMRLCGNTQGSIFRIGEDGLYRQAVASGVEPEYYEIEARQTIRPGTDTLVGRTALARQPVQIIDAWADANYAPKDDAQIGKLRSMLGVPLLREGVPIGVICTARTRVEPFTEKQIELVRTFADQAVIAIENARLLNELRDRTRDLQESLEYQTATSDVLSVISRSTFDLDPVLENVIETAIRLCRAHMGSVFRLDHGLYRWAVGYGLDPAYRDIEIANPIAPGTGTLVGRVAQARQAVQIADAWSDPDYAVKDQARITDARTMLGVPLLRAGAPIGVIAMARDRVEPFSDKEVALVTTFADQAVIAIENARLLTELRERTDELARSVEELKVLAEVGQAVSSTLDLGAVLSTVLNRSVGLTEADAGVIFRYSGGRRVFRLVEAVGWGMALVKQVRDMRIDRNATLMGDAVTHRAPTQITDLRERPGNILRDLALAAGYRSVLVVPLVGADQIYGALLLQRRRPGEFPETSVRLMQTLASQSVLAIQNARLFREIADKSEQLALASQHKSQFLANMSHELRTPLNAILGYAELLVDGIYGEVPEKAMGVLERVQNNGKHLLALINDVLDLSKIEAGQLALTFEDYALPDVVQSVVTATEALASTKGLKMSATVAPGLPTGHGDARRLSQVLLNLVGNAVKFTDEGEVAIGAMAEDGHFVLTVRDTGPGIAPEDHGKIFEEFQQVDSSNTRKKGGTGLGLAISKRMVELQGGSINVESELGHGATFRVTLPIRVEHAADELSGELMGAA